MRDQYWDNIDFLFIFLLLFYNFRAGTCLVKYIISDRPILIECEDVRCCDGGTRSRDRGGSRNNMEAGQETVFLFNMEAGEPPDTFYIFLYNLNILLI